MSWKQEVQEIARRRTMALDMGGPESVARQHAAGKSTVRERIDLLLDPGSFLEVGQLAGRAVPGDANDLLRVIPAGYVAGIGKVGGRDVVVGGEDFTVRGGTGGGPKMKWVDLAANELRVPLILLLDGAGADVATTEAQGRPDVPNSSQSSWRAAVDLLGKVPVLGGLMGPIAGGSAGRAVLTHWSCMVKGTSEVFAAGPPVVKRAIGLDVSKQELGGSAVHVHQSGVSENEAETEADCIQQVKRVLSYLPSNVWETPPYIDPDDKVDRAEEALLDIVPRKRTKPYDMRTLIGHVVDLDSFFEVQPHFGRCIIVGFARLNGHSIGVTANNPLVAGGALDNMGAEKLCHFLELCDTFHIPLLEFVDVPGFLVGPEAEAAGTLRRGMRVIWLAEQMSVPKVTVIVRRLYGMAGNATGNPSGLNIRLAWPSGEWGSIPVEGGVDASFRREIETAPDPALRRQEIEDRLNQMRSVFPTVEQFAMEDLIDPRLTRQMAIRYLETMLPHRDRNLGPKARVGVRP